MTSQGEISIRPLQEKDLPAADRVFRLAFGTLLGLPEPAKFGGDADYVRTRWNTDPSAALGAELDGEIVATCYASRWGSLGVLGPLTVRPDLWNRGIGRRLLEPAMEMFMRWGTKHAVLFTTPGSPKHIALYQKLGFWPRFLTAIMFKPVAAQSSTVRYLRFSQLSPREQELCVDDCRMLTDTVYEGLDLVGQIHSVAAQRLGDTVLLEDDGKIGGLAVCHFGPGTEAGSNALYVKFGAVRPGAAADKNFGRLLDTCEALAALEGASLLIGGVNTARREAYAHMAARGFRTQMLGVAMHRSNEAGYDKPGSYVIDDWR